MKKNICFISTSRADFSYIINLINKISKINNFNLDIILSGSHFSKSFGNTYKDILKNKTYRIHKIKFNFNKNDFKNLMNFSSEIFKNLDKIFTRIKPDCMVVLGDRFEVTLFCVAAILRKIKIIHIGGGEKTFGSADNYFRNAISQMSDLHFVSTLKSKKNLINIGLKKNNIHQIGSLSIENIKKYNFYSKNYLEKKFKIKFARYTVLIVYHPNTIKNDTKKEINCILQSIDKLKNINFIFNSPNFDEDSLELQKKINNFVNKKKNCFFVNSFGVKYYFSILKQVDLIMGNSSSGIIEAPSLGTYSLNLGERQKGREQSLTILNSNFDNNEILSNINRSLNIVRKRLNIVNPYYKSNSSNLFTNQLIKYLNKNEKTS